MADYEKTQSQKAEKGHFPLLRAQTPAVGISRYEDLEGGKGREVFFRPMRYGLSDLGSLQPVARIIRQGQTYECRVVDVSQNGVAFRTPTALILKTGEVLDNVTVSFDQHEAYCGGAKVVSLRDLNGERVVGVSFSDALMSIEDVLVMRDVKAWGGEGASGLGLAGRPWHTPGHDHFKALVAELRLFLEDAQKQFSALEATLPFQVVHGDLDSPARRALIHRVRTEFVPPVIRYTEQADAALRHASPEEAHALREYSLRQIHEFLMLSPLMARARYKPLGYPGDFQVMRFIYEREFEGATLFGKALTLAFTETAAARGVKNRKDFIKSEILQRIDSHKGSSPIRILSIAAGPAQEVFELLNELPQLASPIEVVLFDQEEQALGYAYTRLKRLTERRWPKAVKVVYRYDTIKRLLVDRQIFRDFGAFDIVFSCGLFDYLQSATAAKLCRNLFSCVGAAGSLYAGNMVPQHPTRWLMEHHLDWFLVYKTHEEMLSFARKAVPKAEAAIVGDSLGVNPFVRIVQD